MYLLLYAFLTILFCIFAIPYLFYVVVALTSNANSLRYLNAIEYSEKLLFALYIIVFFTFLNFISHI